MLAVSIQKFGQKPIDPQVDFMVYHPSNLDCTDGRIAQRESTTLTL